jgi:hypothetical protein
VVSGWKHMTVGFVFAGALVAGTAIPASAAAPLAVPERTVSYSTFSTIFEGVGQGPSVPIAVRRARTDARNQAEAAGFDPLRCLEGTPDVDTIRPGQVVAFLDLFC